MTNPVNGAGAGTLGVLLLEHQQQLRREGKGRRDAMHEVGLTHMEIAQIYRAEEKSADNLERTAKWIDVGMAAYNIGSSISGVSDARSAEAARQAQATETVRQQWQAAGRETTSPLAQARMRVEIAAETARLDASAMQQVEEQPITARNDDEKIGTRTLVEKTIDAGLSFTREQYRADDEADRLSAEVTQKAADSTFDLVGKDRDMVEKDRELTTEMIKLQAVLQKPG